MPQQHEDETRPTPDEVRAALHHIVTSDAFRSSPQLSAFLSFVVDAVLKGAGERIKGYTIGVEVLNRNKNFDPRIDPIVRVEATRLRRTLDRYYSGPGADSPVRIALVRGSYVPSFSYHNIDRQDAAPKADGRLSSGNGMPTLFVRPFEVMTGAGTQMTSSTALHEKLCDAFARFDTINVVSSAAAAAAPAPNTAAGYVLSGSIEYRDDGATTVRCRLLDSKDGIVVWSRAFDRLATAGGPAAAEDAIVTELAAILVQPFGVIRSQERLRHLASGEGDPRYRSIVEASESFRSFDPAQHKRAREALEHLTKIDPSFASGFAYLAAIYFREFQYGHAGQLAGPVLLDRALEMARRAIELKPESSRAYQILFGVLFARHEIPAAFAAGDKAMVLNRYDTTILSDYGGRLIIVGEIERGMAMLWRAGEFGTVRPSWHHFYMFLGSYLSGDLVNAIHHAVQITSEDYALGLMAHALAGVAAGDTDRAMRAVERLKIVNADWGRNPRAELEKFFPVAELRERLERDLERAGLKSRQ
jgi:TolB-like protein